MFRFEDLKIWQEAISYANDVYQATKNLPKFEIYGLTSQLKRAAVSISANIAEGSASHSVPDYRNFLDISIKSVFETVSLLKIANGQKYISEDEERKLYQKAELLARRISAFRKSLRP